MVKVSALPPFDAAEYLDGEEAVEAFLEAAFEDADATHIARALGLVARARNMTKLAEEAGITREALYRSFGDNGNPRLSTLVSVMKAMGLRLSVEPMQPH